MKVLKTKAKTELTVKKSRFIALALPCSDISQVKDLVSSAKKEHPDARHVVHAAVVGNNFSYSDDKEPKNTAGRPVLEILKGSGINNICILIIRYFGGILLGTGGLVKAYGDSAKQLLQNVETEEYSEQISFSFTVPYNIYENLKPFLLSLNVKITDQSFDSEVRTEGQISKDRYEELKSKLSDLTNGRSVIYE